LRMPVLRLDGHETREPLRPHPVPQRALLQRLPPAVRAVQDDLVARATSPPELCRRGLGSLDRSPAFRLGGRSTAGRITPSQPNTSPHTHPCRPRLSPICHVTSKGTTQKAENMPSRSMKTPELSIRTTSATTARRNAPRRGSVVSRGTTRCRTSGPARSAPAAALGSAALASTRSHVFH